MRSTFTYLAVPAFHRYGPRARFCGGGGLTAAVAWAQNEANRSHRQYVVYLRRPGRLLLVELVQPDDQAA